MQKRRKGKRDIKKLKARITIQKKKMKKQVKKLELKAKVEETFMRLQAPKLFKEPKYPHIVHLYKWGLKVLADGT